MKYKFECGCEVEILDPQLKENDGLPSLFIDYYNLPDCPRVWDLIGSGRTKGIFQLETNLGQAWAKRLMPESVSEMAALISIIRPGCLKALIDGKSITQHYVDRKHGLEEVEYFHEALEPILKETYSLLVYQEQAIRISQEIAGFTLSEGDSLRKATGKKLPELMAKVKVQFLEGCKKTQVVNEEQAEEIFGWIEKSQKYSFNLSHGVGYSEIGRWTAWVKHHFPFHFFTSWLYYAREKMEPQIEVRQLISDAKYFDIEVCTPSILHLDSGDFGQFSLYQDKIRFGVNNIKGVGLASSKKLLKLVENKNIIEWTWYDFLLNLCSGKGKLSSTTVNGLIQVGAFSHLGTRTQLLYEYDVWNHLTEKEIKSLEKCKDLISSLSLLYSRSTASRKAKIRELIKSLEKPPSPTDDTIYKISNWELDLLGVPLTYSKLDNCKGDMVGLADTTCKEITEVPKRNFSVAGELVKVNEYKIKQGSNAGQMMAFLTLEDDTGSIDIVAFSDVWNLNRHILYEGNTILLTCYLGKGGNVVKNVKNL